MNKEVTDMKDKSVGQQLEEELSYKCENIWGKIREKDRVFKFTDEYKRFLDSAKTEREFVREAVKLAQKAGYKDFEDIIQSGIKLSPGDKVYRVVKGKAMVLSIIGQSPLTNGTNIIGAHVDAPRIDLKQNPLYENTELAFFKTHYYGGIKKYQWLTIPLALHGVVVKSDGSVVEICIGEDDKDPVFVITDLLPHLARKQMEEKLKDAIQGETLNLLAGSIPYDDEKVKDKVKLNILRILNERYGIKEEDFISAELEIVPAFKARDVGFDSGLIGAYGQDDRVCAYTALKAILETDKVERTAICILTDKEEIGSVGNTGAKARFFENFIADLCSVTTEKYSDLLFRRCLENSKMLSADVNAAVDPNFEGTHDKLNAAYIGKGLAIMKFSGVRGKSGASDANAEFIGKIRKIFNGSHVMWHISELGKVDLGGGGTIAMFLANLGVEVIDCGVPVLAMHSPFEITSKVDIYMAYKGYKTFFNKMT